MKKLWLRLRRWIVRRWECATNRCTYYEHYLAYGPAELTHIGYHSAERHCERAQQRQMDWMRDHPIGDVPAHLVRQADTWEKRVRA